MKFIYIHVGPPKTGSTSIQKLLYKNKNNIDNFYIPQTCLTVPNLINHANLAFEILGDNRFDAKYGLFEDLLNEISAIEKNILISSEDLLFVLLDQKKKLDFEKRFNNLGYNIKYIFILRKDFDYFYSQSTEYIRHKFKEIEKNQSRHIYLYLVFFISSLFKGFFSVNVHGLNKKLFVSFENCKKIITKKSNGQFIFLNFNKKDITKIFFDEIAERNISYQVDKMNKTHKKNYKYYLLYIFSFLIYLRIKIFG